jgi:hypothetical protein
MNPNFPNRRAWLCAAASVVALSAGTIAQARPASPGPVW